MLLVLFLLIDFREKEGDRDINLLLHLFAFIVDLVCAMTGD